MSNDKQLVTLARKKVSRLKILELIESYYPYSCELEQIKYSIDNENKTSIIKHIAYLEDLGLITGDTGNSVCSKIGYKLTAKGIDFLDGFISFIGIQSP